MKVWLSAALAAIAMIIGASSAQASPSYEGMFDGYDSSMRESSTRKVAHQKHRRSHERQARSSSSRHSVGGRPRQWCGWWMRTQKGGGPELNLAWNWSRWGSPSGPQVGAVVVWRHHVGMITGRADNGRWIVKSGNDGGQVRERARSVSGAVFRVG